MSTIQLFDTHNHLQDFRQDAVSVWNRARSHGVRNCVVVGTNPHDAEKAARLSRQLPGAYLAVGIHPVNSGKPGQAIRHLTSFFTATNFVALGETGLDYFRRENPSKDVQAQSLREHLAMAKPLGVPVIIHTRPKTDADSDVQEIHDDLIAVLQEEPTVKCVIHCFSGDAGHALRLAALGHVISFAGNLTHDSRLGERLRKAARALPLDTIVVETDAPYVRPKNRSGKNEPSFMIDTLEAVARAQGKDLQTVADGVFITSDQLFNLPLPRGAAVAAPAS